VSPQGVVASRGRGIQWARGSGVVPQLEDAILRTAQAKHKRQHSTDENGGGGHAPDTDRGSNARQHSTDDSTAHARTTEASSGGPPGHQYEHSSPQVVSPLLTGCIVLGVDCCGVADVCDPQLPWHGRVWLA